MDQTGQLPGHASTMVPGGPQQAGPPVSGPMQPQQGYGVPPQQHHGMYNYN